MRVKRQVFDTGKVEESTKSFKHGFSELLKTNAIKFFFVLMTCNLGQSLVYNLDGGVLGKWILNDSRPLLTSSLSAKTRYGGRS